MASLAVTQKACDHSETTSDGGRRRSRLNLQQSPACRNLPVTCRPHKPLASQPSRAVNELRRHFKTEHFAAIYEPSQGLQQLSDFLVGLPGEELQRTAALPTPLQFERLKKTNRKIPKCYKVPLPPCAASCDVSLALPTTFNSTAGHCFLLKRKSATEYHLGLIVLHRALTKGKPQRNIIFRTLPVLTL